MGQGAIDYIGVKGGLDINGIIQDYYVYAGEKVSAGDFVEFINGANNSKIYTSSDTQLGTEERQGVLISAVGLPNNRVLIIHNNKYNTDRSLYCTLVKVENVIITKITSAYLSSAEYSSLSYSPVVLPNGNIFVAHSYGSALYNLYGVVVQVSNDRIIVGTDTQITSNTYTSNAISAEVLSDGRVFIAHNYGSTYHLYGTICSISGTTITTDTTKSLSTTEQAGSYISTETMPNGNIFIAHSYDSSLYLYGMVVSISGTTITSGTDTSLRTIANTGNNPSTCLLKDGNMFVSYNNGNSGPEIKLYAMICTVSGTTITKKNNVQLSSSDYSGVFFSTLLLENGDVFVSHCGTVSYYLYGVICKVDETTIIPGTDTQLSTVSYTGASTSPIVLNGNIFIAHSYFNTYLLYAQIFGIDETNNIPTNQVTITEYETQVRKATKVPCNGVAKTSGIGGDETAHNEQVKIYVPDI